MRTSPAALVAIVALVAACGGVASSSAPVPSPSDEPMTSPPASESASASTAASPSDSATRLVVTLTDTMKIEPAGMTVPAGVPITFVITNVGLADHEFYLGDEAAQAAHEIEMAGGGMLHDEPEGVGVGPGVTKELTYTFAAAGDTIAGCHIPGHYTAGMLTTVRISE